MSGRRFETLAECARAMTLLSEQVVHAAHAGDQERLSKLLTQARSLRPPHGADAMDVLAVCLAVQVDATVPLDLRTAWVSERLDPSGLESVA